MTSLNTESGRSLIHTVRNAILLPPGDSAVPSMTALIPNGVSTDETSVPACPMLIRSACSRRHDPRAYPTVPFVHTQPVACHAARMDGGVAFGVDLGCDRLQKGRGDGSLSRTKRVISGSIRTSWVISSRSPR